MHGTALSALEFDRVVEVVAGLALTPLGAVELARLTPLRDAGAVRDALALTSETVRFLDAGGSCPLDAPSDLDRILAALAIEAHPIEPAQLHGLAAFLGSVARACGEVTAAGGGPYPALSATVAGCPTWSRECAEVKEKVNDAGEVVDDASPELKAIRNRLRKQRHRLRGNLESFLRGRDTAKYLQEKVVAERNGRFVLVIRSEHRTAIPGIVHGTSTSGASLFLEPLSTVDVNNEIVALEEQEHDEVQRVLLALAAGFRRRAADLRRTLSIATALDVAHARARFSGLVGGVAPELSTDGALDLREARHPLLMEGVTARLSTPRVAPATEPVPVDIRLTPPTRALIVTGPNTGGKTVALKTAGLLTLMAQAGLHVPAAAGSRLPVFRSVFADIGDEQSISANLSTFSGHVTNIVEMDRQLTLPALILLDEVGAGTDPVEGGALGRAIVEHFRARGAHIIVTTHDEALKSYGAAGDGVACAAFGFEAESFAPTYRLLYGSTGRSLALEIARRLGLDASVVDAAAALQSAREKQLADHLAHVDEERRRLETLRETLERRERELQGREAALGEREAAVARREGEGQQDLKRSLDARLRSARDEVDEVVSELRARAKTLEREAAERASRREPALSTGDAGALRAAAHGRLDTVARQEPVLQAGLERPATPRRPVRVGARAVVSTLGVEGVVRAVHGSEAEVEVRGKRLRISLDALEETTAPPRPGGATTPSVAVQAAPPPGRLDELNLIGCRVDEALSRAEKHLDQALLGDQRVVRFIHGHGTGQLRRAIAGFLGAHPLVERFSTAAPDEGGAAVTIAELKE